MSSTWAAVITDALRELGVYSLVESIPAEDLAFAATRLNRILDQWAARKLFAWTTTFQAYTLTANHAPHLIGPNLTSPDFATVNAAPRPVRIESAALILNTQTPNVDLPLNLRDDAWWAAMHVKGLASSVPTDLFYSPDWPAGNLNFWPIPNYAYGVRLEMWTALGQIPVDGQGNLNLKATFTAPSGYELALVLTLAEDLQGVYRTPLNPTLLRRAQESRVIVMRDNIASPRVSAIDYTQRRRSSFNWLTGGPS